MKKPAEHCAEQLKRNPDKVAGELERRLRAVPPPHETGSGAPVAGLPGAEVRLTLEIEATIPDGTPEHVVRAMTESSRTLKFSTHCFERE